MIYIVRHGQTNWNIEGKEQGRKDTELNDTGREQAKLTKEKLQGINFDVVISSPLKRALETAQIITDRDDVITDERLVERGLGLLEGMTSEEVKALGVLDEEKYQMEPVKDMRDRVFDFFKEMDEKYQDKNVLVVTHAGVTIFARCYYEGDPPDKDYNKLMLRNAEVVVYDNSTKELVKNI